MAAFATDNSAYEAWLREQCEVVEDGLREKHKLMTKSPFKFLRATYFRWAKRAAEFAPECLHDPVLLAIGDCHIENFGTWRDADSRLVWGVNDFDDAALMPYSLDLVRLATSARLADALEVSPGAACKQIILGYQEGLHKPGPVLLDQGNKWLNKLVRKLHHDSEEFWDGVDRASDLDVTDMAHALLAPSLPAHTEQVRLASWQRGGGSLGRPRYLAVGSWQGGRIVREAKKLIPSGWSWAHKKVYRQTQFIDVARGQYRSPDAVLSLRDTFVIRRLAPDSLKLSAKKMAQSGASGELLRAMARDIGSIHAADRRANSVLEHISRRPNGWLKALSADAEVFVKADYDEWLKQYQP